MQGRLITANGFYAADHFSGIAESGALTERSLARILRGLRPGVTELMTHPGYPGPSGDRWRESRRYCREVGLDALLSPEVRSLLRERRIELITYREVCRHG